MAFAPEIDFWWYRNSNPWCSNTELQRVLTTLFWGVHIHSQLTWKIHMENTHARYYPSVLTFYVNLDKIYKSANTIPLHTLSLYIATMSNYPSCLKKNLCNTKIIRIITCLTLGTHTEPLYFAKNPECFWYQRLDHSNLHVWMSIRKQSWNTQ